MQSSIFTVHSHSFRIWNRTNNKYKTPTFLRTFRIYILLLLKCWQFTLQMLYICVSIECKFLNGFCLWLFIFWWLSLIDLMCNSISLSKFKKKKKTSPKVWFFCDVEWLDLAARSHFGSLRWFFQSNFLRTDTFPDLTDKHSGTKLQRKHNIQSICRKKTTFNRLQKKNTHHRMLLARFSDSANKRAIAIYAHQSCAWTLANANCRNIVWNMLNPNRIHCAKIVRLIFRSKQNKSQ